MDLDELPKELEEKKSIFNLKNVLIMNYLCEF